MTATLILVAKPKTAKLTAKAFRATRIPPSPRFKDLQRLTQELADQKTVVGFIQSLFTGWHAPSNTNIIIHPECEGPDGVDPAMIAQAKLRPKPTIVPREQLFIDPEVVKDELSKKKRIEFLEKRQRTLLLAIEPFVEIGKALRFDRLVGQSGKVQHVVLESMGGHVNHSGEFDPEHWKTQTLLRMFLTQKKFDTEVDRHVYAGLPNEQLAEITLEDFERLDNLVSSFLKTVGDTNVTPLVQEADPTPQESQGGGGTPNPQTEGAHQQGGEEQPAVENGKEQADAKGKVRRKRGAQVSRPVRGEDVGQDRPSGRQA